ncbi:MAG TPA: putative Ig domain-containing protein [Leptospiraceae bacterium]|nr:putative Ig domain-containing protein [Leptospiraceae bacterium]HMX34463.1 putative Ig domain-containing protein [Leptospiraceae bacterium]HMY34257.1 putative Ig domain-containing protein [Leptospiraceae bacterium]HMZ64703.1 putative Ig domain-containing protein [Leptospiraceae bacterium]HNA08954.1 putative Ig domain-containing protein [Leptospiraceae bacterium]
MKLNYKNIFYICLILFFSLNCLKAKKSNFDMRGNGLYIFSMLSGNLSNSSSNSSTLNASTPPSNFTYNGTSNGLVSGSTGTSLLFRRTIAASVMPTMTGTATSITVSPSLPSGLSINATNGTISGTPTVSQVATNYTVTVANSSGSINVVISITVLPIVYAATFGGGLAISSDGGASFTMKTTTDGLGCNTQNGVSVDSSGIIYAANNSNSCTGGISVSTNNGVSFSFLNASLNGLQNFSVFSNTPGLVYVGVYNTGGGLYYSTNGGSSFTQRFGTTYLDSDYVNDIYVTSSNVYIANGFSSSYGVSISTDGGANFTKRNSGNSSLPAAVVSGIYAVGSNVYAATASGLYISTNSGTSFSLSGTGAVAANKVQVVSNVIYVASTSGLMISTNAGSSFSTRTTANGLPSNSVSSVFVYADGTIYVGTNSGIGISTDGGSTFSIRNASHGLTNLNIQQVTVR